MIAFEITNKQKIIKLFWTKGIHQLTSITSLRDIKRQFQFIVKTKQHATTNLVAQIQILLHDNGFARRVVLSDERLDERRRQRVKLRVKLRPEGARRVARRRRWRAEMFVGRSNVERVDALVEPLKRQRRRALGLAHAVGDADAVRRQHAAVSMHRDLWNAQQPSHRHCKTTFRSRQ